MAAPKKPGSDLAALKARLAKKAAKEAPAAEVPAPGQVIQPPAPEPAPAAPEPAPAADIPAPGEVQQPAAPVADVPAPGQVAAPAAAAPAEDPDNPFAGGAAAGFDPNAGVIDGGSAGDIPSRGGKGIVIFAALLAGGLGAVVGFLMNSITGTRERVEIGKTKGAAMVSEVQKVADSRKTISLEMEALKKAIGENPKKGSELITNLLTEQFDKHPKVEELFGWQLASIHSMGIKKTFDLYEEANGLKLDLGYLAGFLNEYGDALGAAGGPQVFALLFGKGGSAMLVEAVKPVCDLEAGTPCPEGKKADAVGYSIREQVGGAERTVPKGTAEGQAVLLRNDGPIYNYAIGLEPNKNALKVYASLLAKVTARLEAMNKAERLALVALQNYSDNPTVDGANPQPEPADPGG